MSVKEAKNFKVKLANITYKDVNRVIQIQSYTRINERKFANITY